jgi:hypothetical protein
MHSIAAAPPAARGGRDRGWRARRAGWLVEHRARILAAIALLAAELAFEVARTVIVDHHMGVDTIALVAMIGSLPLGRSSPA